MDQQAFSSPEQFVHSPLERPAEQIRLLNILPGDRNDIISATVEVVDLECAPEFCAISYVWGSRDASVGIFVNGKYCQVRRNCHYALWQARLAQGICRIWIDAICIDQTNVQEKSFQVAMMGQIYGQAAMVLACVGESNEPAEFLHELDHGLDSLQIERFDRFLCDDPLDVAFPLKPIENWLHDQDEKHLQKILDAMSDFVARPFWSRLWIIQELCAGHKHQLTVLCGDINFSWDTIMEFVQIYTYLDGSYDNAPFPDLQYNWDVCGHIGSIIEAAARAPLSLSSQIVSRIWDYQHRCENPKDQVYGLLGLLDQSENRDLPRIVPDYSKEVVEIALDVASHLSALSILYSLVTVLRLRPADILSRLQVQVETRTCSSRTKWREQQSRNMYVVSCDDHGRLTADVLRDPKSTSVASDCTWRQGQSLIFTGEEASTVAYCEVKAGDIILHSWLAVWILRPQESSSGFVFVGPAFFEVGFGGQEPSDGDLAKHNKPLFVLKGLSHLEIDLTPEEAIWLVLGEHHFSEEFASDEYWKQLVGRPVVLSETHDFETYTEIPLSRFAEFDVKPKGDSDDE